jgi:hypothetical protein
MKNSIRLKSLVTITFLIFLMPFLRTCSDKNISSGIKFEAEAVIVDTLQVEEKKVPNKIVEVENNENRNEIIAKQKMEYTENFYTLIYKSFGKTKLKEYDKSTLTDKTFYPLFGFLIIFFVSILNLIFTFLGKYKITFVLGIMNIVLLILATLGLVYSEIVENLNQIKIGYYLFALNLILIVIIAKKESKKEKNYS